MNPPPRHPRLVGFAAFVALLALLVGLPTVLLALGWGPTPPGLDGWWAALTTPDDGHLTILVLKVAAWIVWGLLAITIITEAVAALRGLEAPRLPGLRWSQAPARRLVAAALLLSFALLFAEAWKFDSDIMVNLTQSQFSDNWAGSELSNITWTASMNNTAQKQLAEWLKNKNTLKLAFGQTHLQKEDLLGETYWEKPQKSTDQIAFESLMQFTLKTFVDPYLSLRADSQFLDEAGTKTLNEAAGEQHRHRGSEAAGEAAEAEGRGRDDVAGARTDRGRAHRGEQCREDGGDDKKGGVPGE